MLYTICDQRTANWNKMGYRYTPVKMAKIQITDNTKCWQRCETRTLIHWCLECKIVSPLWKTLWQFLTNLNILLPHNPAVVLIGIYSNKLKIYVHTRTCRSSTGALFIIAKTWKQTAYLSVVLCLVIQLCQTLCYSIDCSLPGSSVRGGSPGKNTGVGCHALLQGILPTQGWNPGLWHCRQILHCLGRQGSPISFSRWWINKLWYNQTMDTIQC